MKLGHRLVLTLKGFCMGAADVVPGVSGGTMAFILGIYPTLLQAIRSFDIELLRLLGRGRLRQARDHAHLGFLIPLLLGDFAALLFFTRIVPLPQLIITDPEPVYGLFFGLIIGSIIILMRSMPPWRPIGWIQLLLGIAVGWYVINLVPVNTPETPLFVFFSGAVAICAMILPGISGSFILLILRKYAYVFDAVGRLDFAVILPFAVGAIAGLMVFSRILVWLLKHYYQATVLAISGILIASLWAIWPFQQRLYETVRDKPRLIASTPIWPTAWDGGIALSVALMLTGLVAVLLISHLAGRKA